MKRTKVFRIVEFNSRASQIRLRKLLAIDPLLEWGECKRRNEHPVFILKGKRFTRLDDLVAHIAHEMHTTNSTVYRWYKKFREQGWAGLFLQRSDRRGHRYFAKHPEIAELSEKLFFKGKYSISHVHRAARHNCQLDGLKPPAYGTVRSYLRAKSLRYKI